MDKNDKFNWKIFIKKECEEYYFKKLLKFLRFEYINYNCYPKQENIFSFMKYCPFHTIKVVLLGQDPYYKKGQADGLCFSVPNGISFPPSLKNIFIEINNCFNYKKYPNNGSLIRWAKQGVLLLNSILTVRNGIPKSHKNRGWEIFTNKIIHIISLKKKHIVFLLWGKYAHEKENLIFVKNDHYILKTSHPSPFSSHLGFIGCRHFLKTNKFLYTYKKPIIEWK
ncbi:uracil-DNA glycosylase [Blattabacterium cuenoti]|uniref:uracil-DNA glycosylase n=1 Tax=Blattabacterium cuenoti TaxID=1653831 RepID=UPI00163CB183|nr:uracil-DNA glycosylase [Blattabacterium cuenoti]